MDLALPGFEALHGVEQASSVSGGAHEVCRLAQGLEVLQRYDHDRRVAGPGDHDLFAVVDHRVEDLGISGP